MCLPHQSQNCICTEILWLLVFYAALLLTVSAPISPLHSELTWQCLGWVPHYGYVREHHWMDLGNLDIGDRSDGFELEFGLFQGAIHGQVLNCMR